MAEGGALAAAGRRAGRLIGPEAEAAAARELGG